MPPKVQLSESSHHPQLAAPVQPEQVSWLLQHSEPLQVQPEAQKDGVAPAEEPSMHSPVLPHQPQAPAAEQELQFVNWLQSVAVPHWSVFQSHEEVSVKQVPATAPESVPIWHSSVSEHHPQLLVAVQPVQVCCEVHSLLVQDPPSHSQGPDGQLAGALEEVPVWHSPDVTHQPQVEPSMQSPQFV